MFHEVVAEYQRRAVADQSADPPVLMHQAFKDVGAGRQWGVAPDRMEEGLALCMRWVETHDANPSTLEGVELTMSVDVGQAVLTGTVDRMDRVGSDAALITDWKTSYSKGDDLWQLKFYSCLACVSRPHLQRLYARADYVRLSDGVVSHEWSRDELRDWWGTYIVPGVRGLLANIDPQPQGGAACTYCASRWDCAMSIAPYRNEPITDGDRRAMVGELVRLENAADERRAALKAAYAHREPEDVNGLEVGWLHPREGSFRINDIANAVNLLVMSREDPDIPINSLTLDRRKLTAREKKLLLDAGVAIEIPPDSTETEFRLRKSKSNEQL